MRGFRRDLSGAAIIEFALVLPIFLTMLLGITAYGIYIGASHCIAQLAADAARASVAGLDDQERESLSRAHVENNVPIYMLIDPEKIEVEAGPLPDDPKQFRVEVRFAAENLPIWGFTPFLPLPSEIITHAASVKRGGY